MEILNPALKELLWHRMRTDLVRFIPDTQDKPVLMCCLCGRFLPQEDFSLEHILPQQALKEDPAEIRRAISTNQRSGNLLLCKKRILHKGKLFHANGCNGYKGKFYDPFLKDTIQRDDRNIGRMKFNARHHIALVVAAYLAMVMKYGYQAVLTPAGVILREQFFNKNKFTAAYPVRFQMILMGDKPKPDNLEKFDPWRNPFWFEPKDDYCLVGFRGLALQIPTWRNLSVPIAFHLPFRPSKYGLRPDFRTVFE